MQQEATLILANGRRYGLVGRNGTGKTTFMRALSSHSIKGTPTTMQILHVEQEVGPCSFVLCSSARASMVFAFTRTTSNSSLLIVRVSMLPPAL